MSRTLGETLEEARAALLAAASLEPAFDRAMGLIGDCLDGHGKVLACGNGGSAATAQHLVAELVGRYRNDRRAVPAVALTADGVTTSAVANDYGYREVFARQVEAIGRPGDVLVALSTSGRSPNVIEAAHRASALGLKVISLTGPPPSPVGESSDVALEVPTCGTPRIQEVHAVLAHAIAAAVEHKILTESPR